MSRILLCLVTSLILVPTFSRAQDGPTRACDLAAESPLDRTRLAAAHVSCQAALAAAPENPQLLYQMGRIFEAGKDDTNARTFYERAATRGNAFAQDRLGVFYRDGRGGLAKNDQEVMVLRGQ